MKTRHSIASLVLASVLFLTACDSLLSGFRAGFAASKPVIQSLVPKVLTQTQADTVTRDVGDGIDATVRGESCVKSITVSGNEKKIAKGKCYLQVAQDLRVILARHNIDGNQILDQIASIVEAAIAAFEEYNRNVTGAGGAAMSSAGADSGAAQADADKTLEKKLNDLSKQLKALQSVKQ